MDTISKKIRRRILNLLYKSRASHLGSNMSMVEILLAIYSEVDLEKIKNNDPKRDRIFVSKGHSAAATYTVMEHYGLITPSDLDGYHSNGSIFTGHVNHMVDCVEHSTGALGHGINVAVGAALGQRALKATEERTYVVLGDGEIQEGSVWEAIMFACHRQLGNLYIFIDNNGISSIEKTSNVIDLNPLQSKFKSFGVNVREVNGHSIEDIKKSIEQSKDAINPTVIICNTVKGKGISFAENQPIWHYRSLDEKLYEEALSQTSEGNF